MKSNFVCYSNFPVIHLQGISWQYFSIGSSNGLALNGWHAKNYTTSLTNKYASSGPSVLIAYQ